MVPAYDRADIRISLNVSALIATEPSPPFAFRPCRLFNLSLGGAACQFLTSDVAPKPGDIVQLKIDLADDEEPLMAIAAVVRTIAAGRAGVVFTDLPHRDRTRLRAFCLQVVLKRSQRDLASRERRGIGV